MSSDKVNFVDLAGSERVDKAAVDPTRYKEAQNIGKTLTCIGDVIYARRSRGTHVPIRSSRLTHLLQDSLSMPIDIHCIHVVKFIFTHLFSFLIVFCSSKWFHNSY